MKSEFSVEKSTIVTSNMANASRHHLAFFDAHLNEVKLRFATGFEAVRVFVNDHGERFGNCATFVRVRVIALRCAGYNNVDLRQRLTNTASLLVPRSALA